MPEPSTTGLNRYYTVEFFREMKLCLNPEAIISTSLISTANYMSDEARELNSILYNTLKQVFADVRIIQGTRNFFLASENRLNNNPVELMETKNVDSEYVRYYEDDMMLQERCRQIINELDKEAPVNHDFKPVSYYTQVLLWLSHFKLNYWILGIVILIVLVFMLRQLTRISFGLFTGGFAASSIEIILLVSLQVIYGYVFQITGVIFTIFMMGLAVGALYPHRIFKEVSLSNYAKIQFAIGIYSLALPLIIFLLSKYSLNHWLIHAIIFVLTFLIALFVGLEFSIASKLQSELPARVAAQIYSADLFGSAIGALIVSAFLIPLIGIFNVSIVVAVLNFTSGVAVFLKRKKQI